MTGNVSPRPRKPLALTVILLACAGFAVAQRPLYSSNQNTYFLHGLARAWGGNLAEDTQARSTDPFPLFSIVVEIVVRMKIPFVFHLLQAMAAAIFIGSLWLVACGAGKRKTASATGFLLLAALVTVVATLPAEMLQPLFPIGKALSLIRHLAGGFATQQAIEPFFQPSSASVLLALSFALFLREMRLPAWGLLGAGSSLHPGHALAALCLGTGYLAAEARERQLGRAAPAAALAILIAAPGLLGSWVAFQPGDGALAREAARILAVERMPHHTQIGSWWSIHDWIRAALLIAVPLAASRRFPRFSLAVAAAIVPAAGLACAAALLREDRLALLFPLRVSVVLAPACLAAGLGLLANGLLNKTRLASARASRCARLAAAAWVALCGGWGLCRTSEASLDALPEAGTCRFLRENPTPGRLVLVPTELEHFRLLARSAIFADFKSHPYRAEEIFAWRERLELAERYYRAKTETEGRDALRKIRERAPITEVAADLRSPPAFLPQEAVEVYRDERFALFSLRPSRARPPSDEPRKP